MTEGRQVAPFWADGWLCPRCGGPLRWLGEWREDGFRRKPMTVLLDHRASRTDVPERVVTGYQGLEASTELRFRHAVTLECIPCCAVFSEDQARRGTLPPDQCPPSYFVGGRPLAGSANGVQTAIPGTGREN